MTTILIANFASMIPVEDPSLLPDSNAQFAENTWLYRGLIRGFRHGTVIFQTKHADTQQVYRIPLNNDNPPDFTDDSLWLEYPDPFMATVRNPTVDDQYNRYYFFPSDQYNSNGDNPNYPAGGAGVMAPTYNTLDNIKAGLPAYVLGIPEPIFAPIVIPAPPTVTTTASAWTPPGDTVINLTSTAGILVGMNAVDSTSRNVNIATDAITPSGDTVLNFPNSSQVFTGFVVTDDTVPARVPAGATVVWASATQVAITFGTTEDIPAGDSFTFTSSSPIIGGAAVVWVSATQVAMNMGMLNGGVVPGDVVTFNTPLPETRAYVYTYVSAYGEEGPPSAPTVTNGDGTGTWQITVYNPTAGQVANRNLKYIRLYRTVTDTSGNASYYQVTQFDITATNGSALPVYNDSALPGDITANQQLSTVDWTAPPADLQGVVMMANGIAAGWSSQREVWFSAAYALHAWPGAYALSVDYPIVGLTANGASLNIITQGMPFIATGVTPDTMTIGKVSANESCVGRGSIATSQEGAYYASQNGVVMLSPSGVQTLTQAIYEKEFHWSILPWTWAAGRYGQSYVSFSKGAGIPGIDPDGDVLQGLVIDQQDTNVPFVFLHFDQGVNNLYSDELSGQLFALRTDGSVLQWNPPVGKPGTTTLWPWEWKSKKFRFTMPQQFKAFYVIFDIPPEVTVRPGTRDITGKPFDPATQLLIVQIYADGVLLTQREVQKSGEVLMINKNSKWMYWEIRIQGQVSVRMFKMASSVKELKAA